MLNLTTPGNSESHVPTPPESNIENRNDDDEVEANAEAVKILASPTEKHVTKDRCRSLRHLFITHWRSILVVLLPILCSPLAIFNFFDDDKPDAGRMAYCAILMALFWILELVPLAITGILPVFLFPVLGVLDAKRTCGAYFNEVQFIILGGLIIAIAVEKSRVHERIALSVLLLLGSKPRSIMMGLMLVTAFLSMFLSNTATTAMMMPIANAILEEMRKNEDVEAIEGGLLNPACEIEGSNEKKEDGKRRSSHEEVVLALDDIPALRSKRCTHAMLADGCTLRCKAAASSMEQAAGDDVSCIDSGEIVRTSPTDKMLLLCVSYSAQLGGTGLLTGCTPNLVTLAYMEKRFPGSNMNFVNWSAFAFPTMVIVVLFGWMWLQICFLGFSGSENVNNSAVSALIRRKYRALGRLRFNEVAVMTLFFILFLLWFSRDPGFAPGYATLFKNGFMSDAVPAIFICSLLFVIPSEAPVFLSRCFPRQDSPTNSGVRARRRVAPLLDWDTVHVKMPWCILLIMGGGLALAEGMTASKLSQWLGQRLTVFSSVPTWSLPFVVATVVAVTTDLASVMAASQVYTPVMADLAVSLGLNPYLTLLPTTVSASFAFMLPVATPPAAIAFSYGKLRIRDMCKAGLIMNVIGVLAVGLAVNTWGRAIFDLEVFPDWAKVHGAVDATNETVTVGS